MANGLAGLDRQQPVQLIPDYLYEDRHEFVEKLAYKLWEQRGRPLGSPDVDWSAAERAVNSSLAASRADDLHEEETFARRTV